MTVHNLDEQTPFTTKDGSTIRSILDRSNAPVRNQSFAEATLTAGHRTTRHYHAASEEIYFIVTGAGEMTVGEARCEVGPGDAVLIPPGTWHTICARESLRFLCCCAPPYSDADTFFE